MKNENKLICGDCFIELDKLENESIHLCLTDPPYFLHGMDNKWNPKEVNSKKNMKVITSLASGMKFDKDQSYKLQVWMKEISEKVFRVLVPGAYFLVHSSPRLYHRIACAIEDAGFLIKDMYEWLYTMNQPKAMSYNHVIDKRKDLDVDEKEQLKKYLDGWKTPQVRSNHEPIVFAQKPLQGNFLENYMKYDVGLVNTKNKIGNNKFPSNVLCDCDCNETLANHFLVPKPNKTEKGDFNTHKTVKPLGLYEYLITLLTRKEQVVLDPFAGSGTTLLAAKNTNRKYCGIELNEEYCEIIKKRLI